MIGIDTNVLLRLFLADDGDQLARAGKCVTASASGIPVLINPIVMSEFAWTMSRGLKLKREIVAVHIESVLAADDLAIMFRPAAERALSAFRSGKADYPDYLLAEINVEAGCSTTFTFDVDAQAHTSFTPVP